jgi:predicted metalloprotease
VNATVRLVALLAVAALALIVKAQQPGPLFGAGGEAEKFPAEVVARVPPTPNAHRDRPDVRVLQLLHALDVMWQDAFARAGDDYTPPRSITSRSGTEGDGCGGDVAGWAGIYCTRERSIVINLGANLVLKAAAGDALSDDMLGYVLAHEVGHHVQHLRGAMSGAKSLGQESVVRRELHAECLAGVWGKAAGRPLPPQWVYAPDADHGTAEQQQWWLQQGYAKARPADCDAVWHAAL